MSGKLLNDHLHYQDDIARYSSHPQTLWARTRILGGYGLHQNEFGISMLDEVVFDTENMVPLIGVQYALETIFGVKGTFHIPTLNEQGIGAQSAVQISSDGTMPYKYGQRVCMFGIGDGGAAENNLTALEVKYYDTNVSNMIPFRLTDEELGELDKVKYFGKKKTTSGATAYYMKLFDSEPKIRHLYKNGDEGEDGADVNAEEYLNTKVGNETYGVQSFAEALLTISRKDVREYYESLGHIENARVSSIGLFSGVYNAEAEDYENIQLFSKLNIPTEPLSLNKDMNIIYRVYGA